MTKKLFTENGFLSDAGKNLTSDFVKEIKKIFNDMGGASAEEVTVMHTMLMKIVGDSTFEKKMELGEAQKAKEALWAMSDEDFVISLQNKYGEDYSRKSLTPNECDRYQPIAAKEIKEVMRKIVAERAAKAPKYSPMFPPTYPGRTRRY